jgi:hypothetical protein
VHLLVSWPPLRWTMFAVSVYGVLGLIAFDATLRQHPHVLREGTLVLRFGHFRAVRVPVDQLSSVRRNVQNAHQKTIEQADGGLALSFMGGTNLELRFSAPVEIEAEGGRHVVERVAFPVDDPAAAVALLRARVTSPER